MKPKHKKLIKIISNNQFCSSSFLAEQLGVSIRSINNYIKEINFEFDDCIIFCNKVYSIDINLAQNLLNSKFSDIPQTSEERIVFILNSLINLDNNQYIDSNDLADDLYISLSTLKNELSKIKRKIIKFDLIIESKGDLITLKGYEKNKRKLLSSILYDESNVNFINLNSIQKAFNTLDINFIRGKVTSLFEESKYFINDYSLLNLILHITIAIDRIKNINLDNINLDKKYINETNILDVTKKLVIELENKFDIKFSNSEIYEMNLLIISRTTTIDYKTIDVTDLRNYIGEDCMELVENLISEISAYYYINLNEREFKVRFALHISNLLIRSKNNYFSKNPLTEGIKKSCPLIYDTSVALAGTIKEKTGIKINDDEIAYIAFHLGSALESQKNLTEKINAILYCPNYYDINLKLIESLTSAFADDLLITNILTNENELLGTSNSDLIITTIPISTILANPIIQISLFLNDKDKKGIFNAIHAIYISRKQNEFKKYLEKLIIPELFLNYNSYINKTFCINEMCNNLEKLGYVNSSFLNEINERESLSSTVISNFAIPHSMKMNSYKTGISVLINKNPIKWDEHYVNLVLMLSFNKNERYIFNKIFDSITTILNNSSNVKKLIQADSHNEFIELMCSFLISE